MPHDPTAPLARVRPEWVDQYGHMNLAYYLVVFDAATDRVWPDLGLGPALEAAHGLGTFAAETWVEYRRELREGMPLACEAAVLGCDARRLLLRHRLLHADEGWIAAENETLFLCVDLGPRRVASWPSAVRAGLVAAATGEAPRRLSLARRPG